MSRKALLEVDAPILKNNIVQSIDLQRRGPPHQLFDQRAWWRPGSWA